jgi:hypothetical protein
VDAVVSLVLACCGVRGWVVSDRKPQPGDRVRVTYEGTFRTVGNSGRFAIADCGDHDHWYRPVDVEVEVLESADDPSKDPVWTVRTVEPPPYPGVDSNIVIKFGQDHWMFPYRNGYGRLDWAGVKSSRVVGVVPGTPAAEQSVSAEQVGQWEADDLELSIDPHEPVVLVQADTSREPRVFSSDGPEPPPDVKAVVAVDHKDYPHPFFVRFGEGWSCSPSVTASKGDRANPVPWVRTQYYGLGSSFREVPL